MVIKCRSLGVLVLCVAVLVVWNEFLVYYAVLLQCYWPALKPELQDASIPGVAGGGEPLKAVFLADTHLLGRHAHWFDKLRREWQMHRAFQAAMFLFNPEVVFILGDLLDEGKWCSDAEFEETVQRFYQMFSVGAHSNLQLVVGNHDIGFHYMASEGNVRRFERAFSAPAVRMLQLKGNLFVLLNSVAFEGDSCQLCAHAREQLSQLQQNLTCARHRDLEELGFCEGKTHLQYSRPIVLQHYPMYRENDAGCEGPDSAPPEEKYTSMRPKYDCLSQAATDQILASLSPRLVIDAHTHHFCQRTLEDGTPEWTIPSFNWRNKNNPSFLLGTISTDNYSLGKCFLPEESTVIWTYILGGASIVFILGMLRVLTVTRHRRTRSMERYTKLS